MPEAEISPAGDVLVEGHHVGELQGFRFTADRTAEGEDAKAVKAAAQKALAAEFEARAERFAAAANGDLALGSDGILRWLGAPVGTLVAGEDALKPRVILLADEQLTGPARDKVAARADRFVNFQVETLLKPLVEFRQSEHLTGIARGLAFRLVENFGLLNRRDVAEEVRSLDQEARGALRRLGVRFGAYHVFVPALLKPAPAGLATLLWALSNDGKDKPGYGDVVSALAAGRTSVPTDPAFERAFYALAGFRNLGRRAVRVDILERLADLIRPALAWTPNNGPRPEGAYDGNAFVVTPAMMSILGATADDMEAILKGLGYRAEAKPAAEVSARLEQFDAAATAAEPQPASQEEVEPAKAEASEASAEPEQAAAPAEAFEQPGADQQPDASSSETQPGKEQQETAEEPAAAPVEEPVSEAPSTAEGVAEAAEEPKPVLIWRPGRFEGRKRDGRRDAKPGHDGTKRQGRPSKAAQAGKGRPDKHRRNEDGRKAFKGQPGGRSREERPARIDPDSPFAKLAALREQLKK